MIHYLCPFLPHHDVKVKVTVEISDAKKTLLTAVANTGNVVSKAKCWHLVTITSGCLYHCSAHSSEAVRPFPHLASLLQRWQRQRDLSLPFTWQCKWLEGRGDRATMHAFSSRPGGSILIPVSAPWLPFLLEWSLSWVAPPLPLVFFPQWVLWFFSHTGQSLGWTLRRSVWSTDPDSLHPTALIHRKESAPVCCSAM